MKCPYVSQGVRINEDSNMVPCCEYRGKSPYSFFTSTIEQYQQSQFVKQLENALESGHFPDGCIACKKLEEVHHPSLRQQGNLSTFKDQEGIMIDIVLGSECNSDCVMCYPGQSSRIASRLKHHPFPIELENQDRYWTNTSPEHTRWANAPELWKNLQEGPKPFKIKFLGGEPFMNREMWRWLEIPQDIAIELVTNASILTDSMIDILKKWQVNIVVSMDAIDKEYEWIRHGLKWEAVSRNLGILFENFPLVVNCTVSLYSIATIPRFLRYMKDNGYRFNLVPVAFPSLLSTSYAPIEILEAVNDQLDPNMFESMVDKIEVSALKTKLRDDMETNLYNPNTLRSMTDYFNRHRAYSMDWKTLRIADGNDS